MTMDKEGLELEKEKMAKKLEAAKEDVHTSEKRTQELLCSNSEYGQGAIQRYLLEHLFERS